MVNRDQRESLRGLTPKQVQFITALLTKTNARHKRGNKRVKRKNSR